MDDSLSANKKTLLAHLGRHPERHRGAVNTPVVRTSTVIFDDYAALQRAESGQEKNSYGRYGTATRQDLEAQLAALEGAEQSFLCPSGLGAIAFALQSFLNPGDHVLVPDCVYGPTRAFCDKELKRLHIETTFYDPLIGAGIEALMRPNTRIVYLESPGSVTFEVQDTPAIVKVAHAHGALVVADNTWATPLAPSPMLLGVDIVLHAITKYICGHSDVLMGVVSASGEQAKILAQQHRLYGHHISPDDCALVQRGLRTLAVRVEAQEKSALAIAEWFAARPETKRILHPAFASCPGHAEWKRDIGQSSGLFSVVLQPYDKNAVARLLDGMRYFAMGFSWGGYESLIMPLNPKHYRSAVPWTEEGLLLRLHIGLEAVEDLIADLEDGLNRLNG